MAETEDRTVKVTFEADKRGLSESLKSLNDDALKLQATLDKLGEVSAKNAGGSKKLDNKLSAHGVDPKSLSAVRDLVTLEEKLLGIVKDRNKALKEQAGLYKNVAAAGGTPGGGNGGSSLAALFGKGGPIMTTLMKVGGTIAGASTAAIASQMRLGYGAYADYAGSLAGLAGTGATRKQMKGRSDSGIQYGYSAQETAEQARQIAIQTGSVGNVTQAQMLTRATTMDMSQVSGFMGSMTKAGGMNNGSRDMKKIIALGFKSGIDQSRLPEYMQGVEKVVQQQGGMQGGDINALDYAGLLQAMGAGGASGLQGARGAAVFGKLNQAIIKPGGGEAGQALMLQAMGFGKPGGDTNYYEALKRQEKGASPANVVRLFGETLGQYGGGEEQVLALREMTGLGITQLEELRKVVANVSDPDRKEKIQGILDAAKSPEDRAADSMDEVGFHAERIAFLQNRLVDIGRDEYAAVLKLQDGINKLVDIALPFSQDLLNAGGKAAAVGVDFWEGTETTKDTDRIRQNYRAMNPFTAISDRIDAFKARNKYEHDPRHMSMFEYLVSSGKNDSIRKLADTNAEVKDRLTSAISSRDDQTDDSALYSAFLPGGQFFTLLQESIKAQNEAARKSSDLQEDLVRDQKGTSPHVPARLKRPDGN